MNEIEEAERRLIEMIKAIQADYAKQVKPYVDKLVELRSMKIRTQVFVVDGIERRYVGVDGARLPTLEGKS